MPFKSAMLKKNLEHMETPFVLTTVIMELEHQIERFLSPLLQRS